MGQYKIKSTPMFSLKEILGNVEDITRWTLNGLPKENVSFENMIIIDETKRSKYPLMIDPEGQAFAYFEKNLDKSDPLFFDEDEFDLLYTDLNIMLLGNSW